MVNGHHRQNLGHAGHRPDADFGSIDFNGLQVFGAMQEGSLRQGAELFGDPQPYIRGPGDQRGIGVGQIPGRQIVRVFRQVGWVETHLTVRRAGQWVETHLTLIGGHPVRYRVRRHCLRRADNGCISGAAAQISGQLVIVIRPPVQMCHSHRHDKTRRAKPAL